MHGLRGRIISALAGTAGVLAAFVASAQSAGLFQLVTQKYVWLVAAIPVVSLFLTGFSERIQGGLSDPGKRFEAENTQKR